MPPILRYRHPSGVCYRHPSGVWGPPLLPVVPATLWRVRPGSRVIWSWNEIINVTQMECDGVSLWAGRTTDMYRLDPEDAATIWHPYSSGSPTIGPFTANFATQYCYQISAGNAASEFDTNGYSVASLSPGAPVTCVDGAVGSSVIVGAKAGGGACDGWQFDTPGFASYRSVSLATTQTIRSAAQDGTNVWFGTNDRVTQWTPPSASTNWSRTTGGQVNALSVMGSDVYAAVSVFGSSLQKIDSSGAVVWTWDSGDSLFDVVADGSNVWCCGNQSTTWAGGDGSLKSVWKLDSSGNVLWSWYCGGGATKIGTNGSDVWVASGRNSAWSSRA